MDFTEIAGWATHVKCLMCETLRDVEESDKIELMTSVDDVLDLDSLCCSDPYLELMIISDAAVFNKESVNKDALIRTSVLRPGESERWEYSINDDLVEELR